ncbi:MAG: DUF2064 domain-containing protein [Raoultibacter sp.]
MVERKNALLLFSKPPLPGLVKTRLTPLKDGIFTPEVAARLYHCMFFDVVEICCDALSDLEAADEARHAQCEACADAIHDTYDIFISTTPAENGAVMRRFFDESGSWPRPLTIICDEGADFDEHYNDAFKQVFDRGYDTILSMGGDMPTLPKAVVVEGFEQLHCLDATSRGGCVLSPDQEMGVSLVGWTKRTAIDHTGVFYNREGLTVLPAYIAKAKANNVAVIVLPAVIDIDTMADLNHHVTLLEAIEYGAQFQDLSFPGRTIDALRQMGYSEVRVLPNELRDSREEIDVKVSSRD